MHCRDLWLKRRYVELAEWLAAFNVERVVPATPCALLGRVALYRQLLDSIGCWPARQVIYRLLHSIVQLGLCRGLALES